MCLCKFNYMKREVIFLQSRTDSIVLRNDFGKKVLKILATLKTVLIDSNHDNLP